MLLEVRNLDKDYSLGKTTIAALRGLNLSIDHGEFVSIMGPSGCGKTTLLNILGCIDRPTRGQVLFGGTDVTGLSDDQETDKRLGEIGFIFQSFNLVPVLTAAENIELPLVLAGMPKVRRKARVDSLVETVGLQQYRKHRPDELSGGQRQRVAIARALVNEPALVIADEPTANLDSENGEAILEVMGRLNREAGVTFIFSTHNPEILKYAGRHIRLRDGRLVEDNGTRP
ncbi:MAG: ABC transporter ATP-binding protein [Spirochaetota bacterium]